MTPRPTDRNRTAGPLGWWFRHHTRGLLVLIVVLVAAPLVASVWPAEEAESLWAWLSAVFIPRGPNVSQGAVRVVPRDSVQPTDWTLREFLAYQWSLGTAVPHEDEP